MADWKLHGFRYNKLHLFDLEIPGKVRLMESEFSKAGTEVCIGFFVDLKIASKANHEITTR